MQAQAAFLKREIEAKLANRIPAALSPVPQQASRLHPIGNARLDSVLGGGLPLSSMCELTGHTEELTFTAAPMESYDFH